MEEEQKMILDGMRLVHEYELRSGRVGNPGRPAGLSAGEDIGRPAGLSAGEDTGRPTVYLLLDKVGAPLQFQGGCEGSRAGLPGSAIGFPDRPRGPAIRYPCGPQGPAIGYRGGPQGLDVGCSVVHGMGLYPGNGMGLCPGHGMRLHSGHGLGLHSRHGMGLHSGHGIGLHSGHGMGLHSGHGMGLHSGHGMGLHSGHGMGLHSGHGMGLHSGHGMGLYPGQGMDLHPRHEMSLPSGLGTDWDREPTFFPTPPIVNVSPNPRLAFQERGSTRTPTFGELDEMEVKVINARQFPDRACVALANQQGVRANVRAVATSGASAILTEDRTEEKITCSCGRILKNYKGLAIHRGHKRMSLPVSCSY